MKALSIILAIVLLASCHKKAQPQVKYWMYTVQFTVEGGCTSEATGTTATPTFTHISENVTRWVYPDKLTTMHITRMTEIPRAQLFTKGTPYKCEPDTSGFGLDTLDGASSSRYILFKMAADSIHYIVWTLSMPDLSNHSEITAETLKR